MLVTSDYALPQVGALDTLFCFNIVLTTKNYPLMVMVSYRPRINLVIAIPSHLIPIIIMPDSDCD